MKGGGALFLLLAAASTARADCPDLDPPALAALARAKGAPLELVFFASWCAACKEHLTAAHGPGTILIGAFDKRERIEAVAAALAVKSPCYVDRGVAEALGVVSLPKTLSWSPPPGAPRTAPGG